MVNIAVMGHGVVGSGVVELLLKNRESIARKTGGRDINVKYILDLRDFVGTPYDEKFTKNFDDILNDDDVKIVVEVMGGCHPAYEYAMQCMQKGKCVVTSNKELVAQYGDKLLDAAKEYNVSFLFEASVGGGIPIIRPLHQCLAANEIYEIAGILNGTTNYILTKMFKEGIDFDTALRQAQELGYAERNPAADVEGHDACRKICILASLAFGKHIYPDAVTTNGITDITLEDVEYASIWGGVIKLIGSVKKLGRDCIDIIVAPMFVPSHSQLASIDDVFNGIMVRGDCTGDVVFYGKGAGKLPTASAVVADIVDSIKHLKSRKYLSWADSDNSSVLPYEKSVRAMYVRGVADDAAAAYDEAKAVFGDIHQLSRENAQKGEIAFITEPTALSDFEEKLGALKKIEVKSVIRIGDL